MKINDDVLDMTELRLRNRIAAAVGVIALLFLAANMSVSFFPGMSARLTAVSLGLEPRLSPAHPLWMLTVWPARLLPARGAVFALNLWSVLCGALSAALLYRYFSRWILSRVVLDGEVTERSVRLASLTAVLVAVFAFATSAPLLAAATRLHVLSFHTLLILVAFNLLQDNIDAGDAWRPFALALLCGAGCVESSLFLLVTPYFAVMQLIALYKRDEATWSRFVGLVATGLLGVALYIPAVTQFAGTESYELAGYAARRTVLFQMVVNQLAELKTMFSQSGWIWIVVMIYAPWLAIQFEARHGLNNRREVASIIFNVVLVMLALPVLFNSGVLPWADALPEGRLPVLELLLTAMTIGYVVAFWLLRFLEPVELADDEISLTHREERQKIDAAMQRTAGVLASVIVLLTVAAAIGNIGMSNGRGGRFAESYATALLEQRDGADWIVTDGMLDTLIRLAAWEKGISVHLVNLARERDPVQIRNLQQVIRSDDSFGDQRQRYLNSARIGCAAFLQEWLAADPEAVRRLAFYTLPDLLYEAGFEVETDRLLFRGMTDKNASGADAPLEKHHPFWSGMENMLEGKTKGSPLAVLRGLLRRQVSMCANNLGVSLEDRGAPEAAYQAYEKALLFDPENFSALLNRVVLTRRNINPLEAERAEIEAEEMFRKIRGRPASGHLARYYGYVRVPGEFARQGFEWMHYGRPRLAESSMQRALAITPLSQQHPLLHGLAEIHLSNSSPDESEQAFRRILELFPNNADALLGMARVCIIRRETQAASEWLEKAVAAGIDLERIELERARIEIVEGRFNEAQKRLQVVTDRQPGNLDAWASQANLLLMRKKLVELERDILPRMKVITLNKPRYETALTEAYLNLAKGGRKDLLQARENFLLALKLRPGSRSLLSEILKIDFSLSDLPAAERHAAALLRLDRNDGMANYVMGSILVARGELEGAEDYLRRAVAVAPSSSNCNDLAEVLRLLKKLPEAEQSVRRAIELKPENPFAHDTLACVLLDAGRVDEALAACARAREFLPELAAFKLTAARILETRGDKIEARVLVHELGRRKAELNETQRKELEALSAGAGRAGAQL